MDDMNPSVANVLTGLTVAERVQESAETIRKMVLELEPGDRIVVERHAERKPGDALFTVKQITHQ